MKFKNEDEQDVWKDVVCSFLEDGTSASGAIESADEVLAAYLERGGRCYHWQDEEQADEAPQVPSV